MSSESSPDKAPKVPTGPADRLETPRGAAARTTRLVATLVLIPAVPLLLLSVAALLLFYTAPTRLNNLLAQLPGDEFIRLALFFAPATLFAVVVLAVIYTREGLDEGPAGRRALATAPGPALPAAARPSGRKRTVDGGQRWAPRLLAPVAAALLASLAIWLLSFVAPGRFGLLVDPLPGTSLIRLGVRLAPLILGLTLAGTIWLTLRPSKEAKSSAETMPALPPRRAARTVVILLLLPAVPMLLISLGALFSYYLTPDFFQKVLAHLGSETFLRLVLLFAPVFLFAVIALAWLYLSVPGAMRSQPASAQSLLASTRRESLAVVVLMIGLATTALIGSAVLGVLLYLLVR